MTGRLFQVAGLTAQVAGPQDKLTGRPFQVTGPPVQVARLSVQVTGSPDKKGSSSLGNCVEANGHQVDVSFVPPVVGQEES